MNFFLRQLDELQERLYLIPLPDYLPDRFYWPRHQFVTILGFTASGAAIINNNGVIRYKSRYRPVSTTSTVESELVIHQ